MSDTQALTAYIAGTLCLIAGASAFMFALNMPPVLMSTRTSVLSHIKAHLWGLLGALIIAFPLGLVPLGSDLARRGPTYLFGMLALFSTLSNFALLKAWLDAKSDLINATTHEPPAPRALPLKDDPVEREECQDD